MSGHVSDEDREALVAWFHREFGYHRCVHPVNSEPQCEAWASQFLRSAPASALITRHVREALNAAAEAVEEYVDPRDQTYVGIGQNAGLQLAAEITRTRAESP